MGTEGGDTLDRGWREEGQRVERWGQRVERVGEEGHRVERWGQSLERGGT